VPTVLQLETAECGAACLAMVLAAHGRWTPLAELREACGVGRDGVKASNILVAAREAGLLAKGLRVELGDLAAIACPFVAFWNFNHFVVVEQYRAAGRRRAWINDPNGGPRAVGGEEFAEAFTGVVLTFERRPDFRPRAAVGRLADLVTERLRGFGAGLRAAFVAGLLLVVPGLVAAGAARVFIDGVVVEGSSDWLWKLAGGLAALALLRGALAHAQRSTLARAQTGLSIAASREQMWRMLHLDLGFFLQRFAGDIASRFSLVDRLAGVLTGGIAPGAVALVSIAVFCGALFGLDAPLASIALAAAALALAVLAMTARAASDASRRLTRDEARLQAATTHGLSVAEELKAQGAERAWLARWMGRQARLVDAQQRAGAVSVLQSQAPALVMALAGTAVLIVGGWRVIRGDITIGVLLAFQTVMASFATPVLSLVGLGGQLRQARAVTERLDDIVNYRGVAERAESVAAQRELGLSVRNVSFAYGPFEPTVIEDVSFDCAPGARVAIVGATASGKSTLGRLAAGMLEPTAGEVRLGGAPLAEWPRGRLRAAISYLQQEPGLFEGAARDNITLWDASIGMDRVTAAARDARAHDFIMSRESGYDFRLAEHGGNASGGERQCLALARALVGEPLLLVLDEATSALDPVNEKSVMEAVRRRGVACIVIAHRLSTVRDCDLILVMRQGCVVEQGTHAELMALDGLYCRLVET
jgi:NHLM bacteriocin system ABC transporter peptidase/ATP-binding protein